MGVIAVSGDFRRGEMLVCVDEKGVEVARGLTNYNSDETAKILRRSSDEIAGILGYVGDAELIHRDNLVMS